MSQLISPLTSLRILVVEDEFLIRWSIVETLKGDGCRVAEAENAAMALRVLSETAEGFDAVVLDYRLPDSNDLGLLAHVRQVAPRTVVLLMTAFGTHEVVEGAKALGVHAVISKPFEMRELETALANACRR